MEIKHTIYLGLLLICCISCKKSQEVENDYYDRPVVQAFLVPGVPIQVKVYYQKFMEDTLTHGYPITDLKLKISNGTEQVLLSESSPGVYDDADSSFVKDRQHYVLSFDYLGKTITAETTVPEKPTGFSASGTTQVIPEFSFGSTPAAFIPLVFKWNNPGKENYMMVFKNIDTYKTPADTRFNRTYQDMESILGTVSSYQTQQMSFNYLGNYQVLLFHINEEYNKAISSSSSNSLNLTPQYTNVVNGLGIFTAMRADTLNVLVTH